MTGSRRPWLLTLLLGIVLFAAGLAAGRAVRPPTSFDAAGPDGASEIDISGDAATSEPTEVPEAVDGPEGFARSPDGAVAAATEYGLALDGPGLLDPRRRATVLEHIAASESRTELQQVLGEVADLITSRLALTPETFTSPGFVWRVIPAGWQLREYADEHAIVAVWATGVVIAHGRPLVEPGWRTTEVELVWERGDWRLVGFSSEQGPTPPTLTSEAGGSAARLINQFQPFRYLPADSPRAPR